MRKLSGNSRVEWEACETRGQVRLCMSMACKQDLAVVEQRTPDRKRQIFPFNQADTLVDGIVTATRAFGGDVYELIERTTGEMVG